MPQVRPKQLAQEGATDGQILTWNNAAGRWEPQSGGGGGDNISVNGSAATNADFDNALPAAPSDGVNVRWQSVGASPTDISANVPVAAPGTIQPDDTANAGSAASVARSDHRHAVVAAAPAQGIGGGNTEGAATSFARSDHDHTLRETGGPTNLTIGAIPDGALVRRSGTSLVAVTPRQEAVTTQAISGTDTALTDTLNATPISNASVTLYFNGLFMRQGAGFDYTLSGMTITWLAGTGTAPKMKTSDQLVACYWS